MLRFRDKALQSSKFSKKFKILKKVQNFQKNSKFSKSSKFSNKFIIKKNCNYSYAPHC